MAIDQIITGNEVSAVANPSGASVDVIAVGETDPSGHVLLEFKTASMADYRPMAVLNPDTKMIMATPDTTISYRFRGVNLTGDIYVYLGP